MLSSSTSFLSFSCRFLILQVLRFTMRDWLALPITTTTNEEQRSEPSWFTILNVFSIAKKLKNNAASSSREIIEDCKDNEDHFERQQEDQHEESEYEEDDDDDDEILVTQKVNKDINKEQDEEDSELEEDEESRLPRTFSSSSIATSTDTEHSTHEYTYDKITNIKLYWNHGGNKVQVTGEFDNWSGSVNMVREAENRHVVEIPMDLSKDIEYKFIVDGEWKYAIDLPHRPDFHGNINNVIYKK